MIKVSIKTYGNNKRLYTKSCVSYHLHHLKSLKKYKSHLNLVSFELQDGCLEPEMEGDEIEIIITNNFGPEVQIRKPIWPSNE